MSRPIKQPDERRDERLNLRLTAAEKQHVHAQAEMAGLTPMEYVRRRALGYVVPPAPSRRVFDPALISEINRVGNNVNQLARAAHTGREFIKYWREVGQELTRVLDHIVRAQANDDRAFDAIEDPHQLTREERA